MLKELQDIGLSEKEAGVYIAALELGPSTADQLAKQSKVRRSTTYVQIESLMKKGLMSTYEEDKKTFFAPESPTGLKRILSEQQRAVKAKTEDLNSLLPDLTRMFESAGERPLVRFFEGKEGITAMRQEALGTKKKEFLVIYSHDALAKLYTEKEREEYSQMRVGKDISLRAIYSADGKYSGKNARPNSDFRYISKVKLPLSTDIIIYDDSVGLSALGKRPFAIQIKGSEISESFRSIFKVLWGIAE